ncbi:MAG TPA: DMT family transporter [Jiangellaceae bacterium]|nr:DMT family transporter [Jiangellaceae bacterium]
MTTTVLTGPTDQRNGQQLATIAAVITVILWASAFVAIRAAADHYSPGALAFGRLAVGTLGLGVIAMRYSRPRPRGKALKLIIAYGVAWFAGYTVVLNQAEHHLDAGTAAMLVNVAPILVAVSAGLLLGEGFPRTLIIGVSVAFVGVVIIAVGGPDGALTGSGIGIALALLAAVLYASGALLQKVALRTVDAVTATFWGCLVGAIVLVPFAPQFVAETVVAPPSALAVVVYLGVFPTAIAFSTWAWALARTNAGPMTATTLAVPAIAVVMSWVLLGELPTILAMAGGMLCVVGVAISRR